MNKPSYRLDWLIGKTLLIGLFMICLFYFRGSVPSATVSSAPSSPTEYFAVSNQAVLFSTPDTFGGNEPSLPVCLFPFPEPVKQPLYRLSSTDADVQQQLLVCKVRNWIIQPLTDELRHFCRLRTGHADSVPHLS
ncbi:MAG: hypothetical protein LWW85_00970 [Marinilabiliales bacterium]|nr:hypothetical protein [Marinilabiliales bacterium]